MPYKVSLICGAAIVVLMASLLLMAATDAGHFQSRARWRSIQAAHMGRDESRAKDDDDESSYGPPAGNGWPL